MTAQIAVANMDAIALASDSAITMVRESGPKIFTSANKLFALSKCHPVGVMVYGDASFMRVPWETVIKIYRVKLGSKRFDTLGEYAKDFLRFLDNGNPLFPDSVQKDLVGNTIFSYFALVRESIMKEVASVIDRECQISENEVASVVSSEIGKHHQMWEDADTVSTLPNDFDEKIHEKYGDMTEEAIVETFEQLPISGEPIDRLRIIGTRLLSRYSKQVGKLDFSGVVVAGFGEEDTFPSVSSYHLEGIVADRLKYKGHHQMQIGFDLDASIVPFAQSEMVHAFMEGIDPSYLEIEQSYITSLLTQYGRTIVDGLEKYTDDERIIMKKDLDQAVGGMMHEHFEELAKHRKETQADPILSVVSMLPKDELAAMAETLVSMTSFKRRVTTEGETVGGPIDVAVISKGDGLVWIKRKHYFKPELNPQFFADERQEGGSDIES